MNFIAAEKLLRAVRDKPNLWKKDGSLSPTAFRTRETENGSSVFRVADRSLEDSVNDVANNLEGAVVSVTCGTCENVDVNVTETNTKTHHCELTDKLLEDDTTALKAY